MEIGKLSEDGGIGLPTSEYSKRSGAVSKNDSSVAFSRSTKWPCFISLLNYFVLLLIQCSRSTGSKNGEAKFDEAGRKPGSVVQPG